MKNTKKDFRLKYYSTKKDFRLNYFNPLHTAQHD